MYLLINHCKNKFIIGRATGEAAKDEEGMQTMRRLGKIMAFFVKSINDGKKNYNTNFNEERKFISFLK